ncbi:MAG: cytochrome c maturation protein CcmE [Ardenticatenaceae bacterium]|nr:cytochrome c maturation protein CcmE [Ardenticatenaceae bacterium]MCB9004847.1 cytochrome c maturation protein CcmE [Ardenticatenaceae bacterium]
MADVSWTNETDSGLTESRGNNRLKFIAGGVVMIAAIAFLVFNAMSGNTQLYKTVEEFHNEQASLVGRDLRVAGWVLGDSIQFEQIDAMTSRLEFDIVDDYENPDLRLHIVAMNEPMPDLLQDKAQALVEGSAGADGVFMANSGGLMLKCPTRYEEMDPSGHPDGVPVDGS